MLFDPGVPAEHYHSEIGILEDFFDFAGTFFVDFGRDMEFNAFNTFGLTAFFYAFDDGYFLSEALDIKTVPEISHSPNTHTDFVFYHREFLSSENNFIPTWLLDLFRINNISAIFHF